MYELFLLCCLALTLGQCLFLLKLESFDTQSPRSIFNDLIEIIKIRNTEPAFFLRLASVDKLLKFRWVKVNNDEQPNMDINIYI